MPVTAIIIKANPLLNAERKIIRMTKPKKPKKPKKYLNNKDLLAEVIKCKENDNVMSDELAKMLTVLATNYSKKVNFANYTYNSDMIAYAMMMLVRTWDKFNPEKYNNPFAFYTQCVKNSFIQYLNQEKRQRLIRDEILVKKGLTPSFNYQLDYERNKRTPDEEDHHQHVKEAEELKSQEKKDELFEY